MRWYNMHHVLFNVDWDYIDIYETAEAFLVSNNEAMLTFWCSRDALGEKDFIVW